MTGDRVEAETSRRWTHLLFGLPAFFLPALDWRLALLAALAALVMNFEFLPRMTLAQPLFRSDERRLGGIVLYPLTVALLILVFRDQLEVAAVAWLILAFGDPAAAYFGSKARRPWFFNPRKSQRGSLAFLLAAVLAVGSFHVLHETALLTALLGGICASVFAAFAEALPWPRDDNLLVGFAAAVGQLFGTWMA